MTGFYRFLRGVIRAALRFYYSDLEVHGLDRLPASGPAVLVANHPNGMVDPLFLIAASPRPVRFLAKAPLFRIPILGAAMRGLGCIPVHRAQDPGYDPAKNEGAYDAAGRALGSGGLLGIFPEGRSHVDPALGEFKHGAAKMALEAEAAAGWSSGLVTVPVGIHFERTRLFRGKVLVTFGEPVPAAGSRAAWEADPRRAVDELTQQLRERLSRQVLDAESAELERLSAVVERLGVAGDEPGLLERFRRRKLILDEYRRLRESRHDEVEELRRRLRRYDRALALLGAGDAHVAAEYEAARVLGFALRNSLGLAVGLPFLAAGLLANAVPYWLVRSCVALSGPHLDVRASVGLLTAILLFPAWYAAAGWWSWGKLPTAAWAALLVAGPGCGLLAVGWLERWRRIWRETGLLWMAVSRPARRARLQSWRADLVTRIHALLD